MGVWDAVEGYFGLWGGVEEESEGGGGLAAGRLFGT